MRHYTEGRTCLRTFSPTSPFLGGGLRRRELGFASLRSSSGDSAMPGGGREHPIRHIQGHFRNSRSAGKRLGFVLKWA